MSACECDDPKPLELSIPAGLDALPRQLRSFPDVREALLRGLAGKPALRAWQARSERDLGLMWLEMWAYVSDVLAFYDERIANESYLRTAHRRTSLRRLNELLGHIQNPGIAGEVRLALLADGRKTVAVPAGTGFRTDAFDGEAPQVYESLADIRIHSLQNQFRIGPIRKGFVPQATPSQEASPSAAS